ncbi:hypothetical protein D3C79_992660 [compost metagenome]
MANAIFSANMAESQDCAESSKAPMGSMNWVSRMKCRISLAQQPRTRNANKKKEKKLVWLFITLRTSSAASTPLISKGRTDAG